MLELFKKAEVSIKCRHGSAGEESSFSGRQLQLTMVGNNFIEYRELN